MSSFYSKFFFDINNNLGKSYPFVVSRKEHLLTTFLPLILSERRCRIHPKIIAIKMTTRRGITTETTTTVLLVDVLVTVPKMKSITHRACSYTFKIIFKPQTLSKVYVKLRLGNSIFKRAY